MAFTDFRPQPQIEEEDGDDDDDDNDDKQKARIKQKRWGFCSSLMSFVFFSSLFSLHFPSSPPPRPSCLLVVRFLCVR